MAGLVLFTTSSCSHCKPVKAILEEFKAEYEDTEFEFATIVIDKDLNGMNDAIGFGVQAVPTVIFFKDGEETHRMVGGITRGALEDYVEKNLQRDVEDLNAQEINS